jgi:hypothetical protein
MKITRAGLRGMITEALQEMSMYGGPEEGMEPGSAEEAGEQLLDIVAKITELNRQALDLVENWGNEVDAERARRYWYGQISVALGSRAFLGKSMHSMRDSADDLIGAAGGEEMFEARRPPFKGNVKGATFHQDPVTGQWVTGGEDFEGPGGRAASKLVRGQIVGMKSPAQLRAEAEVDWNDFAPYGMDQVGEAFVEAGGDAAAALSILQAGLAATAEDEDF